MDSIFDSGQATDMGIDWKSKSKALMTESSMETIEAEQMMGSQSHHPNVQFIWNYFPFNLFFPIWDRFFLNLGLWPLYLLQLPIELIWNIIPNTLMTIFAMGGSVWLFLGLWSMFGGAIGFVIFILFALVIGSGLFLAGLTFFAIFGSIFFVVVILGGGTFLAAILGIPGILFFWLFVGIFLFLFGIPFALFFFTIFFITGIVLFSTFNFLLLVALSIGFFIITVIPVSLLLLVFSVIGGGYAAWTFGAIPLFNDTINPWLKTIGIDIEDIAAAT
jgi:hypothetical protein